VLLIKNIGQLFTATGMGVIDNAAILIEQGKIHWCGPLKALPAVNPSETIDAAGRLVLPGLIDCHTHLLFAGSRAGEFKARMENRSYEEIQRSGGGIFSTVRATVDASDSSLLESAVRHVGAMARSGVTTIEVKSGYGLSWASEMRLLRLIKELATLVPVDIHPTFMGAHAIPEEYRKHPESYVDIICRDMLPAIAEQNLARDCDIFCDRGNFDLPQAVRILRTAHTLGLGLKAHVNQLTAGQGLRLIEELPLNSVSHADFLTAQDVAILQAHSAVVEILPFANLFLRVMPQVSAHELQEKGINLAVASNFNPGSAMCHDLVLAARLAVTMLGFSLEQALLGLTAHAAWALNRPDVGQITPGAQADIVIAQAASVEEFFYDWTTNPVKQVIKRGVALP
jgi:imidazolonepropionase